ncbi:MAG TPA: hypothetical protein VN436_09555 [Holophaga sp.]|nr:hypothetical protein [Holophaga sp.]
MVPLLALGRIVLLVLLLGVLWLRLRRRQRGRKRICPHCGQASPARRMNCSRCATPLFPGR